MMHSLIALASVQCRAASTATAATRNVLMLLLLLPARLYFGSDVQRDGLACEHACACVGN